MYALTKDFFNSICNTKILRTISLVLRATKYYTHTIRELKKLGNLFLLESLKLPFNQSSFLTLNCSGKNFSL